jgi:hypothetical protein
VLAIGIERDQPVIQAMSVVAELAEDVGEVGRGVVCRDDDEVGRLARAGSGGVEIGRRNLLRGLGGGQLPPLGEDVGR